MKQKYFLIVLLVILTITKTISQNSKFDKSIEYFNEGRYSEAITSFSNIDTTKVTLEIKALWAFYLAESYNYIDKQDEAYRIMVYSKSLYKLLNKENDVLDCNLSLINILGHQNNLIVSNQILDEIKDQIKGRENENPEAVFKVYLKTGGGYLKAGLPEEAINVFSKSLELSIKLKDSLQIAFNQMNLGTAYQDIKNYKNSLAYTKKALNYLIKINDKPNIAYNYNNQAQTYKLIKEYDSAEYYYLKANKITLRENKVKSDIIFYDNLHDLYFEKRDYKKSVIYLKKHIYLRDSINELKQNIAIQDYQTKYQTAEKEKKILEQKNKIIEEQTNAKLAEASKNRSQTVTYGLVAFLLLGSIIAFLVYRNTKRKQRIAEQDRELQIQKTETILKEKELETINAMVSGQEKERLRLAGELHDNIGSTLATVRMQVENLERNLDKVDDPKALLQKANLLINETYEKVRGISHKSNSGVMAKEGLLPAVEKLARTVSTTNKLAIDVQDFGLENRIPNELEITIFRIIQELVTNIVKHAQATEATISLTQHDNELNIIVEDNGKGFKVGKLEEKDGMGLGTIERRVEHLEGTMEVDSTEGRGTSVSIDIPLQ